MAESVYPSVVDYLYDISEKKLLDYQTKNNGCLRRVVLVNNLYRDILVSSISLSSEHLDIPTWDPLDGNFRSAQSVDHVSSDDKDWETIPSFLFEQSDKQTKGLPNKDFESSPVVPDVVHSHYHSNPGSDRDQILQDEMSWFNACLDEVADTEDFPANYLSEFREPEPTIIPRYNGTPSQTPDLPQSDHVSDIAVSSSEYGYQPSYLFEPLTSDPLVPDTLRVTEFDNGHDSDHDEQQPPALSMSISTDESLIGSPTSSVTSSPSSSWMASTLRPHSFTMELTNPGVEKSWYWSSRNEKFLDQRIHWTLSSMPCSRSYIYPVLDQCNNPDPEAMAVVPYKNNLASITLNKTLLGSGDIPYGRSDDDVSIGPKLMPQLPSVVMSRRPFALPLTAPEILLPKAVVNEVAPWAITWKGSDMNNRPEAMFDY
ncbi:hypothetical protein IWQ62_005270 [Dispira parvispora]|uniref:Uncharacterized protein n=1 Tax=Dispira parvispora TaxID=1520584 RepID=A0A9W8E5D9_9FUNG|nr:hypothetical protein IWQ62_005270 [Dispira parvispora]